MSIGAAPPGHARHALTARARRPSNPVDRRLPVETCIGLPMPGTARDNENTH